MCRFALVAIVMVLAGCPASTGSEPTGPRQSPSPLLLQAPSGSADSGVIDSAEPSASELSFAAVPATMALIVSAGTPTVSGYRILVAPDGQVAYQTSSGTGSEQVPAMLARNLFGDLSSSLPLASLPAGSCTATSAHAALTVSFSGQQTPDLACPGGGAAQAIAEDVEKIVEVLGITLAQSGPASALVSTGL